MAPQAFRCDIKGVFQLSWPIILGMLSHTIIDVTDTLFVAQLGKTEVAGVGISSTVVFFITSFFFGLLESIKIVTAQFAGAKRYSEHKIILQSGLYFVFISSLLIISLYPLASIIFYYFGGPSDIQSTAVEYFKIRIFEVPFWFLVLAFTNYLQAKGNTKTPMKINFIIAGTNIILDALLIFGIGPFPQMGVSGSALATVLAMALGAIIMVVWHSDEIVKKLYFNKEILTKMLSLGIPIAIRTGLQIGGWTFFTALIAKFGQNEIAANSIVVKVMMISLLPAWGISESACILSGQFIGKKDLIAAKESYWSSLKLSVMFTGFFALIFISFNEAFIKIFQNDLNVVGIGKKLIIIMACFQFFDSIILTTAGMLNGAGDTKFTMCVQIILSWLFMLPLAYYLGFTMMMGVHGIWMGLVINAITISIMLIGRFKSNAWTDKSVVAS